MYSWMMYTHCILQHLSDNRRSVDCKRHNFLGSKHNRSHNFDCKRQRHRYKLGRYYPTDYRTMQHHCRQEEFASVLAGYKMPEGSFRNCHWGWWPSLEDCPLGGPKIHSERSSGVENWNSRNYKFDGCTCTEWRTHKNHH